MAKMRESFTCPSAEKYVKMSVKGLGVFSDRTPYMVHAALFWFLTNFISTERVGILTGKLLLDIRKRALRKVSLKNQ